MKRVDCRNEWKPDFGLIQIMLMMMKEIELYQSKNIEKVSVCN